MSLTAFHQRSIVPSPLNSNRHALTRRIDHAKGCSTLCWTRGRRNEPWRIMSASEGQSSGMELRTLPIFPLSVVALPGCTIPLFIFEARYRVLFNTLLAGGENLDEELVQDDSPFKGTREFGMCFSGHGGMAKVGTLLRVTDHQRQPDGQMVIVNEGIERFQVTQVLKTQPVVVCEVEMLPDTPDDTTPKEVEDLSNEVSELYRNVARLTRKVRGNDLEEYTDPDEIKNKKPEELSYWFATLFTESQLEQQKILEERSCRVRLLREKKIFDDAVKYLSAASAVKGAFQSDL